MSSSAYPVLRRTIIPLLLRRFRPSEGLEHLPTSGPVILAANHISYADPALLSMLVSLRTRRKVHFLTAEYVYRFFERLRMARWIGLLKVPDHDKQQSLEFASQHLQHGGAIGIYPEGQINLTPQLPQGKTGAIRLSWMTRAPIIPVGIFGPQTRSIREAYSAILLRPQLFCFKIGKPYTPKAPAAETPDELRIQTRELMQKIGELSGKISML